MILFLDFDGVTHPRVGSSGFIDACMSSLKEALKPFDIEIVVSSTWRLTCHSSELQKLLSPLGKPIVGVTPELERGTDYKRQKEIVSYISQNNITKWIAIDDSRFSFFPDQSQNVYFTNPKTGFTADDIAPLKELLSSSGKLSLSPWN
jgi:hypothetical protein